MKIHCYAAMGEKQPLERFEYEAPVLGDFDVQVSITHCGICYSDVHFTEVMPMSEVNEAIAKLKDNKARYRIVLKN